MNGYILNIEKETLENTDYRRVLYTTKRSQLVLMSIQPGDDIGKEIHDLDQFIRIEQGNGRVYLQGEETNLSEDMAVIIPAGVEHNVVNTGSTELKLYSIYTPPEHKDKIVHKTKADDAHEHFDGITTN